MKRYLVICLILCSCQKYYVSVQKQRINRTSLASTFVKSPDPLQKDPPRGERLYVKWCMPPHAMAKPLTLKLKMLYKNYDEQIEAYPHIDRTGHLTYEVIGDHYRDTGGLLTYKAEVVDPDDKVIRSWHQQMWVELIDPPELIIDPILEF